MSKELHLYPTIGLEIHAELKTASKMFSPSANDPDESEPNKNIHPIDLAHPGTIPTINQQAIEHMVKIGLAVGGKIANYTEFDRKNYFYPDIPKGYQISQYKYPIVTGGELAGVKLTRIHLEEDTGTNKHDQGNFSLVDYNRAGIPLMELVTEPVIHDAETASNFARELQLILRYLGVAEANMEKGEMRVEANISVSPDKNKLGTKVEVKNINSFKAVEKAIAYEIERMTALYKAGREQEIIQETRGWDENKNKTFSQRKKENAHDYRYFPDPDLPKLYLHDLFDLSKIKNEMPELPIEKRIRLKNDYNLKTEDIETYINDPELSDFFEEVAKHLDKDGKQFILASNYITSDIIGFIKKNPAQADYKKSLRPDGFAKLIKMIADNTLNSRAGKDILIMMLSGEGIDPEGLADKHGFKQENDIASIEKVVRQVVSDNPQAVLDFKDGNENSVKFLMGQVMKLSKGSANPAIATELLKKVMSE